MNDGLLIGLCGTAFAFGVVWLINRRPVRSVDDVIGREARRQARDAALRRLNQREEADRARR